MTRRTHQASPPPSALTLCGLIHDAADDGKEVTCLRCLRTSTWAEAYAVTDALPTPGEDVDYSWADASPDPVVAGIVSKLYGDPEPEPSADALAHHMAETEAALERLTGALPAALEAMDLQDTSALYLIQWAQTQRRALTELERTATLYAGQNLRIPRTGTMPDGRTYQVLKGKDRKSWQHDEWQHDVRAAVITEAVPEGLQVVDTGTGEVVESARRLAQRTAAAVEAVHGSGPPRTTAMRRLGLDPDAYCETSPGPWTVTFTEPAPIQVDTGSGSDLT